MFGPSVGGLFYDLGGFKLPFFFLGGSSLLVSIASLLLFYEEEDNENESNSEENIDVSWLNILKSPGVWAGLLGTTVAAIALQWYSASVEIYFEVKNFIQLHVSFKLHIMQETFGFTSTKTGLVLMSFGIAYTITTPLIGFLTDRGFSGYMSIILGNLVIAVSFTFLGPIPPLNFIGKHIRLTIVSMSAQGKN